MIEEKPFVFTQGLQTGDYATFIRTGDKYTPDGWELIPVTNCLIMGFKYPRIVTDKGSFHYSRYAPGHNQGTRQGSLF
jgi:hypothetical protein